MPPPVERHVVSRLAWLRAAVLGANDGILSTASLILGVAAGGAKPATILVTGVAGLVAGAMSMAAGEYVSVSSQADSEGADLNRERRELRDDPVAEEAELAGLYVNRGLDAETAKSVAQQLMAADALGAHAQDELGISSLTRAKPIQAALASAGSFTVGAAAPLLAVILIPASLILVGVPLASILFLASLGVVGAVLGGAPIWPSTLRVTIWGALAMAVTAAVGRLVGTAI